MLIEPLSLSLEEFLFPLVGCSLQVTLRLLRLSSRRSFDLSFSITSQRLLVRREKQVIFCNPKSQRRAHTPNDLRLCSPVIASRMVASRDEVSEGGRGTVEKHSTGSKDHHDGGSVARESNTSSSREHESSGIGLHPSQVPEQATFNEGVGAREDEREEVLFSSNSDNQPIVRTSAEGGSVGTNDRDVFRAAGFKFRIKNKLARVADDMSSDGKYIIVREDQTKFEASSDKLLTLVSEWYSQKNEQPKLNFGDYMQDVYGTLHSAIIRQLVVAHEQQQNKTTGSRDVAKNDVVGAGACSINANLRRGAVISSSPTTILVEPSVLPVVVPLLSAESSLHLSNHLTQSPMRNGHIVLQDSTTSMIDISKPAQLRGSLATSIEGDHSEIVGGELAGGRLEGSSEATPVGAGEKKKRACGNCGNLGHDQRTCYAGKEKRCAHCTNFGHTHRKCFPREEPDETQRRNYCSLCPSANSENVSTLLSHALVHGVQVKVSSEERERRLSSSSTVAQHEDDEPAITVQSCAISATTQQSQHGLLTHSHISASTALTHGSSEGGVSSSESTSPVLTTATPVVPSVQLTEWPAPSQPNPVPLSQPVEAPSTVPLSHVVPTPLPAPVPSLASLTQQQRITSSSGTQSSTSVTLAPRSPIQRQLTDPTPRAGSGRDTMVAAAAADASSGRDSSGGVSSGENSSEKSSKKKIVLNPGPPIRSDRGSAAIRNSSSGSLEREDSGGKASGHKRGSSGGETSHVHTKKKKAKVASDNDTDSNYKEKISPKKKHKDKTAYSPGPLISSVARSISDGASSIKSASNGARKDRESCVESARENGGVLGTKRKSTDGETAHRNKKIKSSRSKRVDSSGNGKGREGGSANRSAKHSRILLDEEQEFDESMMPSNKLMFDPVDGRTPELAELRLDWICVNSAVEYQWPVDNEWYHCRVKEVNSHHLILRYLKQKYEHEESDFNINEDDNHKRLAKPTTNKLDWDRFN